MHFENKAKPFCTLERKYYKSQIIFKKFKEEKNHPISNGLMRSNEFFSCLFATSDNKLNDVAVNNDKNGNIIVFLYIFMTEKRSKAIFM